MGSRRLRGTTELLGRELELAWLDAAWDQREANVVTIVALGGVGKTTLIDVWRERLLQRDPTIDCVFDWSFYEQDTRERVGFSADTFLREALQFFGAPEHADSMASPLDKATKLAELVGRRRALLILDGLQSLQLPGREDRLELEHSIAKLLVDLAVRNRGLCVVTTRELVRELVSFEPTTAPRHQLDTLSDAAGAELLRGLFEREPGPNPVASTPGERMDLSKSVRGHALSLRLLGSYIRWALGEVSRWRELDVSVADDQPENDWPVVRILEAYVRHLAAPQQQGSPRGWFAQVFGSKAQRTWSDGQRQLALLELLTLFDRPADPGCIAALTQSPSIAGLTEPLINLDAQTWRSLVSSLEQMQLLTCREYEAVQMCGYDKATAEATPERRRPDGAPKPWPARQYGLGAPTLDIHPLVRKHLAPRLRQSNPAAWREGNRRLYEHLCKSVPYWPEGFTGLLPLYQAVAHGCAAGQIQATCDDVYHARILRGRRIYSTHELGAFPADLAAVACFFERAWDRPSNQLTEGDRAWMLGQAASNLRGLGRLDDALEPMRAGLELRVAFEHWNSASIAASNLSDLEMTLGRTRAAVEDAAQSLQYADRCEDVFTRMVRRTSLAHARHRVGDEAGARELFEQAETMQAEQQPGYSLLYSRRGHQYAELLLSSAERAAWRAMLDCSTDEAGLVEQCSEVVARATRTLGWASEKRWLVDIALDHLTLGQAALYAVLLARGPTTRLAPELSLGRAREHIDAALDGLRKTGEVELIAHALSVRAWLVHHRGHLVHARTDLDDAWSLVQRGPMPLHQADVLLTRARLFQDRTALARARELITQHDYGRRVPELVDAQRAAQSWPERVPS